MPVLKGTREVKVPVALRNLEGGQVVEEFMFSD